MRKVIISLVGGLTITLGFMVAYALTGAGGWALDPGGNLMARYGLGLRLPDWAGMTVFIGVNGVVWGAAVLLLWLALSWVGRRRAQHAA